MAGSVAEERIRAKAEAFLRANYSDARIIHELMMEQGGCRLDLAAVGPDYIALVEIKSERDVLDRLPEQLKAATRVSNKVMVVVAEKKLAALAKYEDYGLDDGSKNPNYCRDLSRCWVMVERDDDLIGTGRYTYREPSRIINAQDLLQMLWAEELRAVCYDMGARRTATRTHCIKLACDILSGREVRQRVCRQLRQRPFPRADAPIKDPRLLVQAPQDDQKAML